MLLRVVSVLALLVVGCSGHEDAACSAGSCVDAAGAAVAAPVSDAAVEADATCAFTVDEAGITHGCKRGGQGPGDRDDGGGIDTGAPDVAMDASDLPFGSPCWDNAQCASGICFDYKVKGTACTQRCTTNSDCPSSSLGCNGMGVCRLGS